MKKSEIIQLLQSNAIKIDNTEMAFQNIFMNIINNKDSVQSFGILVNIKMAVGDIIYNHWEGQYGIK